MIDFQHKNFTLVSLIGLFIFVSLGQSTSVDAQIAIKGKAVFTMAGAPIRNGVVLIDKGKITAVGSSTNIQIPDGYQVFESAVVTPGLIDAHSVVGVAGMLNQDEDQDQLERSDPVQPQLRAIDAYNARDELVAWVRSYGVTSIHTGHAPGELVSGQSMVVKTAGRTVEAAIVRSAVAVCATLSSSARKSGSSSPGTRGKMIGMLRADLIRAQEYSGKIKAADNDPEKERPDRDLKLEALVEVLEGKLRLLITADKAQDISSALRLKREFKIELLLDSAAESYQLIDEIKEAEVPVVIHPTMARATGERENLSFETASKLVQAGIPVALQSGFEPYVPKTRVVLFEAGLAAAYGLNFQQALATITIDAAKILGIDKRVGSLEVGKDADVALYDGDPFEYTSHCIGVFIDGKRVSDTVR